MDEKLLEGNLRYLKGMVEFLSACLQVRNRTDAELETTCDKTFDHPHNYCCMADNGGGMYHSDCRKIIEGCFTRVFSLALRGPAIPLHDILASEDRRRVLYTLSLAERRRLKDAMKVEYRRLISFLTRTRLDITMLQKEYEAAGHLAELITPIQRLPVELLIFTFSFIPGGENEKFGTLLQTCRRWRDIVYSIRGPLRLTTWTSVDRVKTILDRDPGTLSVTIDPSMDASDVLLDSSIYAGLALGLSISTSRWRTLKILSLPDPQQADHFFGEHSQVGSLLPLNLNQLRSLSILLHHDPSPFLDLLLPSISPMTSVQLTNMHLCSSQAILYFAQPHCTHVFNSLTSFKCSLRGMSDTIDILPHFWQLESLDVSNLCFPAYGPDVELPLTRTLRQMSLHVVPLSWMKHRTFPQLESCMIISPPPSDTIENIHIPTLRTLTLHSPQWGISRGNHQLFRLCGAVQNGGIGHLLSLHLYLTCSTELLLGALCFMVELKELILSLDHPTVLGRRFFLGLLPRSTRSDGGHEGVRNGENQLSACPSLEVLGLKYRRWFRSSELNNMLLLVATVGVKREASRGIKIWVDKGVRGERRVEVVDGRVSAYTLRDLDCIRHDSQVLNKAADDIARASLAILNSTCTTFRDPETIAYLSPTVYPSLFPWLRISTLAAQMDYSRLLKLLPHLEHLEQLSIPKLFCKSPMPGLSLFQTLKRMHLGATTLHWMTGCTFFQLEDCRIDKIDDTGLSTPQSIRMPACTSLSISPSSVRVLDAFSLSQLHHLHLSMPGDGSATRGWGEGLYGLMRQFNLRSACFQGFDSPLVLRSALAVQNELEVLEIMYNKPIIVSDLSDLFTVLTEPNKMGAANTSGNSRGGPRSGRRNQDTNRRLPLCPDLKALKIKLCDIEPSLQPGMIQVGRRFLTRQKRKHLGCCQFWWEKDEWNGTPPTEFYWVDPV